MNPLLNKYAHLLVHYCLELKEGEKCFITSTTLAEPLVREIYREALKVGAIVDVQLSFREQKKILLRDGGKAQLEHVPPLYELAMNTYNGFLNIMAPFNLKEEQEIDTQKAKTRRKAMTEVHKTYFERTANRSLKRSLCVFPTQAFAQNAGMSLEDYEHFVFNACKINEDDPIGEWLKVREHQQKIVDFLAKKKQIRYFGEGIDITFSTEGRTWINSDGRTNMPSGEVYTSPVEDSVEGHIHYSYPAIYMGHEVEGVTLWVKKGEVIKWEANRGKDFLDHIFAIPGARRFGEAAIGTNFAINRHTKNILFDEKIGGTIHMAIGQSYLQAGGKNESSVHWDMIAEMRNGGIIFADDEKVYENGEFLFL